MRRKTTDEQFECREGGSVTSGRKIAGHHRQLIEVGGKRGGWHVGNVIMAMTKRSWTDILEELYAGSWNSALQRFRSPFAFRGLSRANHLLTSSLARLSSGGIRDRAARGGAPPQLSQVCTLGGGPCRLGVGLDGAGATSGAPHSPSRLDVFPAGRASFRNRKSGRLRHGRRGVVRELRSSEQTASEAPEEDSRTGRIGDPHGRTAQRLSHAARVRCARPGPVSGVHGTSGDRPAHHQSVRPLLADVQSYCANGRLARATSGVVPAGCRAFVAQVGDPGQTRSGERQRAYLVSGPRRPEPLAGALLSAAWRRSHPESAADRGHRRS